MSNAILIVGAGVSGLTFAQGLAKRGIPFQVYDRDASLTARAQGYRFRISDDGLNALQSNLTDEQFKSFKSKVCSDPTISNSMPAVVNPETAEPGNAPIQFAGRKRPEAESVDRTALRTLLLEGIKQYVHFEKAFESYRETDGGVTVKFTDGSEVQGIALVGADGSWSRIRKQLLPDLRLLDTEGRLIFGKTDLTDDLRAKLLPDCAKGPSMLMAKDKKFLVEPMYFDKKESHVPSDYVYWVLFSRSDEYGASSSAQTLSAGDTYALAQNITKDWHPSLRCLVDNATTGQAAMFRILTTAPPIRMHDNAESRVTLLGDAIHPMSPTAALGATTALRDTAVLVRRLEDNGIDNVVGSFREYEREMCAYADQAVKQSQGGGKIFFKMREFDELPVV